MDYHNYIKLYRENLLEDVIPFWLTHSDDKEYGGYLTCLDRKGEVFNSDKFIWLQGRQVWTFSMLYNNVEQKQEWLEFAIQGAEFLKKHGRDDEGNWYFSLTQEGKPLVQPYNIFSDCFACMCFGQLYRATQRDEYAVIALKTFQNILKRQINPKGIYAKEVEGSRPLKNFALPMILCNLVLEIEPLLSPRLVNETIKEGIHNVMDVFHDVDSGLILENIGIDGQFSDSFEGRLINPGHGIEAMWFVMDIAKQNNDLALITRAKDITLSIIEFGWDQQFGGIYAFMDIKGTPTQQLEWDQKIWWVHIETMISLLKGFELTGDPKCWEWFQRVHEYTWNKFPDPEYGEWFGYLNRQGETLLSLKGGKWKGCFHVPRGLYQLWKTMESIAEKNKKLIHSKI